MRPRALRTLSLLRFVDSFDGFGRELRSEISKTFDVSMRTVESELLRLVEKGFLIEETLPGRGGPKRYHVAEEMRQRMVEKRFVTLSEMSTWGDVPVVKDRYARLLDYIAETEGENYASTFDQLFRDGKAAYCDACVPHLGKTTGLEDATALSPTLLFLPGTLDPVCKHHVVFLGETSSDDDTSQSEDDRGDLGRASSAPELIWPREDEEHAPQQSGRWVPRPMETAFTFGLMSDASDDDASSKCEDEWREDQARRNARIMALIAADGAPGGGSSSATSGSARLRAM
jgi:hypothetical protein